MAWRNNNTGIFNPNTGKYHFNGLKGVSDILGVLEGGRFLAIEVKSARGRISEDQTKFIEDINENGGLAFVAKSLDDVVVNMKGYIDAIKT